jgi:Zn-finger nucleic acid-binding protein
MECPHCHAAMREESLDGHLGRPIAVDLCLTCQVFWFDTRESLRLSPASTLRLFRIIGGDATGAPPGQAPADPACPRCAARLQPAKDMQRRTRFEYRKCPNGHGRLTTFFNFLREKDFIRPLSAAQIADLRRHVQTLNCSNCGGPIDLGAASACPHCGSPLSMLDMDQAGRLVAQLRQAEQVRDVDPALPLRLTRASRDVHGAFDAFERDAGWFTDVSASGLVGAGMHSIAKWLKGGVRS